MFSFGYDIIAQDKITGFEGQIIGRSDYMTGCNQYLLQPSVNEKGEFVESRWFDEDRLLVVRVRENPIARPKSSPPGADKPAPRK